MTVHDGERGPTQQLDATYLRQCAYQRGDLLACCGCLYTGGGHYYEADTDTELAKTLKALGRRRAKCKCHCHDTGRALEARTAALELTS